MLDQELAIVCADGFDGCRGAVELATTVVGDDDATETFFDTDPSFGIGLGTTAVRDMRLRPSGSADEIADRLNRRPAKGRAR